MTRRDLYRWMVAGDRWDTDVPLTEGQELAARALMGDEKAVTALTDKLFARDAMWGEASERSQVLAMLATLLRGNQFAMRAREVTDENLYKTATNPTGAVAVFQVVIDQTSAADDQARCENFFPPKTPAPKDDTPSLLAALANRQKTQS